MLSVSDEGHSSKVFIKQHELSKMRSEPRCCGCKAVLDPLVALVVPTCGTQHNTCYLLTVCQLVWYIPSWHDTLTLRKIGCHVNFIHSWKYYPMNNNININVSIFIILISMFLSLEVLLSVMYLQNIMFRIVEKTIAIEHA